MLQHLGITQPLVSASKSPLNTLGPSSPSGGNAKSPPGTVDPSPRTWRLLPITCEVRKGITAVSMIRQRYKLECSEQTLRREITRTFSMANHSSQ